MEELELETSRLPSEEVPSFDTTVDIDGIGFAEIFFCEGSPFFLEIHVFFFGESLFLFEDSKSLVVDVT